jgi:hypothetical protein
MHDRSRLSFAHITELGASVSGVSGFTNTRILLEIQRIKNGLGRRTFYAFDDLKGYSLPH